MLNRNRNRQVRKTKTNQARRRENSNVKNGTFWQHSTKPRISLVAELYPSHLFLSCQEYLFSSLFIGTTILLHTYDTYFTSGASGHRSRFPNLVPKLPAKLRLFACRVRVLSSHLLVPTRFLRPLRPPATTHGIPGATKRATANTATPTNTMTMTMRSTLTNYRGLGRHHRVGLTGFAE